MHPLLTGKERLYPQTGSNLKTLASEADDISINKSRSLVPRLKWQLQTSGYQLLRNFTSKDPVPFKNLVYIPTLHSFPSEAAEQKFRSEMTAILAIVLDPNTLVASGERYSPALTLETMQNETLEVLNRFLTLGLIVNPTNEGPEIPIPEAETLYSYESDLVAMASQIQGTNLQGVDSPIGIYLQSKPPVTSPMADDDAKLRLGIEARTRFALAKSSHIAQPDQPVVFVQELQHRFAVESWARRHSVNLKIYMTKSAHTRWLEMGQF